MERRRWKETRSREFKNRRCEMEDQPQGPIPRPAGTEAAPPQQTMGEAGPSKALRMALEGEWHPEREGPSGAGEESQKQPSNDSWPSQMEAAPSREIV